MGFFFTERWEWVSFDENGSGKVGEGDKRRWWPRFRVCPLVGRSIVQPTKGSHQLAHLPCGNTNVSSKQLA